MSQTKSQRDFDLQDWLRKHEYDQPHELQRALEELPSSERTLALLTWLHDGDLKGQRITLRC
ncbi:DNA-directed RNA polymerase specialized sigma24 family protein [Deinobacterium chartae]|uniref:DNA-directed RNA polymerase specialized sigma24 family protein n=1 Tax=Deinobacterium chartae TaxID=521158 RepID=A0A841I283_9DEIO|nr:hypothetical protein [Deinobacterium chartae]MBB6098162.1 DNA-directed RNA polymerase specialized sigma24 family protein [Deinobacterium chartae]